MAKHISDDVSTVTDVQVASERSDGENLGHLIVIGGVAVGHVFDLEKVQVHIGRDASADVQILEPGISRIHARITRTREGIYLLEDAGSRNGTYCNNNRVVGSYQLRTGDKIQLGSKTVIKFAYRDGAEADFHQAMYDAANRDGLTDIFNRRYFEERLGSEFDLASRYGHPLSLLMLDLDHFKEVNDTHGHPVGDQVLKEFADLVYKATRTDDITARVGGEEFAVLCRQTDLIQASILGERIRRKVSEHSFVSKTHALTITVSIGIAALPDPMIVSPTAMINAADECLYRAKQHGRNCVINKR